MVASFFAHVSLLSFPIIRLQLRKTAPNWFITRKEKLRLSHSRDALGWRAEKHFGEHLTWYSDVAGYGSAGITNQMNAAYEAAFPSGPIQDSGEWHKTSHDKIPRKIFFICFLFLYLETCVSSVITTSLCPLFFISFYQVRVRQ